MSVRIQLATLLASLEKELAELGEWSQTAPSQQSLESTTPFCIDTLSFPQWLQFIFIPRLNQLILMDADLPGTSGVTEMATEVWKHDLTRFKGVIDLIGQIDRLLCNQ